MSPKAIAAALHQGEVPVHAGLHRHEAELAASELDRLGAAIDLRLSATPGGAYPILKPDAERRSGTAVGGFIDDSATPPRFAASGVRPLPLEPESTVRGLGGPSMKLEAEPSMTPRSVAGAPPVITRKRTFGEEPQGLPPPPQHNMYAPPGPPMQYGSMPAPTPAEAPDALAALSSELDKIAAGDADMLLGTIDGSEPTKGKPKGPDRPREFDRVASRPSAAQRQAARDAREGKAAANAVDDALSRAELEAGLHPSPAVEAAAPEPAAPPPKKKKKKEAAPAPRSGPPKEEALELDFAAAGLSAPPIGGMLRSSDAQAKAGQSGVQLRQAFGAQTQGGPAVYEVGSGEPRPLLGPDRTTAALFGLVVGLGVSLFVTVSMHKGIEDEELRPLEEELQESLKSPGRVSAGEVRTAAAIEGDLEEAYGDLRQSFLLKFLLIGVPLGFLLGRGNRPGD
jgi:hypothetical protein